MTTLTEQLVIPRRNIDVEAWRERMEAKRAQNARRRAMEQAAKESVHRPARPAAKPKPRRKVAPKVRDCAACGRPTRPWNTRIDAYPGTVLRGTGGKCGTCAKGRAPKSAASKPVPIGAPVRAVSDTETHRIITGYQSGATIPALATSTGRSTTTIRRVLARHGITLRDDRKTGSGSQPKVSGQQIDRIRELYTTGMTQPEVAAALGTTTRVIQRAMARHGIPARVAAPRVGQDNAAGLRQLLIDAGTTPRDVRAWAVQHGHDVAPVGIPPATTIRAYLAAKEKRP